jgi:hypothetical protein
MKPGYQLPWSAQKDFTSLAMMARCFYVTAKGVGDEKRENYVAPRHKFRLTDLTVSKFARK